MFAHLVVELRGITLMLVRACLSRKGQAWWSFSRIAMAATVDLAVGEVPVGRGGPSLFCLDRQDASYVLVCLVRILVGAQGFPPSAATATGTPATPRRR